MCSKSARIGCVGNQSRGQRDFTPAIDSAPCSTNATRVLTKQPVAPASRSGGVGIGPARAGDIQVDPGRRADELLEKLGRRDRPAPLPTDVLPVGHLALELFLEIIVERKPPDSFPGSPAGGLEFLTE